MIQLPNRDTTSEPRLHFKRITITEPYLSNANNQAATSDLDYESQLSTQQ